MSLIKPKFAQAANALCHVSVSNRNAFSLFQSLPESTHVHDFVKK